MQPIIATLDFSKVLSCHGCGTLPSTPLLSDCCHVVACESCIDDTCPNCGNWSRFRKSILIEKIFAKAKAQCPYECERPIPLSSLSAHLEKCPNKGIPCPICKAGVKVEQFMEHMLDKHLQQAEKIIVNSNQPTPKQQKPQPLASRVQPKCNPFANLKANPGTKISQMGRTVCGGNASSYNRETKKINRMKCCIQQGSCGKCMQIDRERFGLPRNVLINSSGRLCEYDPKTEAVTCGITFGRMRKMTCNQENPCNSCLKTTAHIKLRYYTKDIDLPEAPE